MGDVAKWFKDTLESFKDDPEFQAEQVMLSYDANWPSDEEPILRDGYDGD